MTGAAENFSHQGWDIRHGSEIDSMPWGDQGNARVKILGEGDGYTIALIQAEPGYKSSPHQHAHTEFFYLVEGTIRNQGETVKTGDGYVASIGSQHEDFEVLEPSTYLSVFRL